MASDARTGRSSRTARGRRRRGLGWAIALVVAVGLLVAADSIARAVAENVMATKIQQHGLSVKPDVTIDGFPFLTQAASKDLHQVGISAADVPDGPVTITSVHVTATGVRVNSYAFDSGMISHVSGSALIDFASVGNAVASQAGTLGTLLKGAGLVLTAAGPDEVKASLDLVVATGSATWRVAMTGPDALNIRLVSSSGVPAALLGSLQNITVRIPALPLGLTISSVRVTRAGIVGAITGTDVAFGG